jgi:hypothetical protein
MTGFPAKASNSTGETYSPGMETFANIAAKSFPPPI